jgi:hypothetical protein
MISFSTLLLEPLGLTYGWKRTNRHGHISDCTYCRMRPKEARRTRAYRNSCHGSRSKKGKNSGIKKKTNERK